MTNINNWPTKKLGEIAFVDWGNTSITKASYKPSGYLAVSATGPDGFMDSFEHNRPAIILSAIGAKCGKTFWVEGKWTAIKNTITIFSNEEKNCLTKYLYYFLTPNKWKIVGGGQPFITKGAAESVKIPLPPLQIQKQIVERLDKIAEAQKLNDELIQKADELFQSLLHKELNPTGPADAKAIVGKKNWGSKKLGECLIQFDRGISWSRNDEGGSTAVLRIPNIEEGNINFDDLKHISTEKGNGKLEKNDIVMVASNGNPNLVGRSALVTRNEASMLFASFLVRLRFDNAKLLPQYAHLFLLTPTFKQELRRKIATTSGIYNLRKEHIEKIKITLPPIKIQKQIVEKLSAVQKYKKQLLAQKSKLKELFESVLNKSMK